MESPTRSGRDIARAAGPVGYALALAARAHRADLTQRLAQLGLHPGQELIVVDLHENPESTQAELVERMGIEQPTIAKTISRMERSGFVERTHDDSDRRVIRLRLSARGQQAVEAVRVAWRDAEIVVTSGLSGAERRQLVSLLQRIAEP
ncbi:MarR family winged helix-turn-helix transcriptional regulator [Nocardia vaccinii]|uniref:MarR family winged helix-turn-helix transcriptional regulator n=1 Tax=Nocardia vaccinii TaxID=1822 RepID=UPI000835C08C|nr:MarR family winged helix-turn-helix transcriptional regulator [Nocardia vaccinii]